MKSKHLLLLLIGALTIAYPFIVYASLQRFGPSLLSLALLILLVGRVVIRGDFNQPEQRIQLLLVGSLCVFAAVFTSQTLLRYYPVAMSLCFAAFFLTSLNGEKTLVERFASAISSDFEPYQIRYMRRLTVAWAILLIANAGVASYTACCTDLATWTLYNGAIAYAVLIGFMLLELIFRHFYKKRYDAAHSDESGLGG
ncbi:MAG: hypothetical protein AB8B57_08310 [Congregibacter sp.]